MSGTGLRRSWVGPVTVYGGSSGVIGLFRTWSEWYRVTAACAGSYECILPLDVGPGR